jgi:hypothetical protein
MGKDEGRRKVRERDGRRHRKRRIFGQRKGKKKGKKITRKRDGRHQEK